MIAIEKTAVAHCSQEEGTCPCHAGPHGQATVSYEVGGAVGSENMAKSFYCGLCGKEWARQGNRVQGWLV